MKFKLNLVVNLACIASLFILFNNIVMKKLYLIAVFSFFVLIIGQPVYLFAQSVGIGTTSPDASAQLDITHTSKGLLIPRMSTTAITSISSPAKGLMVYDSVLNILMVNMGTAAVPNWETIAANSGWALTGNSGTSSANNFLGTKDAAPLLFKVNSAKSGYIDSGASNTFNTSFGFRALDSITTGANNVALGYNALISNTTGTGNTATGTYPLYSNTTGNNNNANGSRALYNNTTGYSNTADGAYSLLQNTTGYDNTANGFAALYTNTIGFQNTASGDHALDDNTTGNGNTAVGSSSLELNSIGAFNTAIGSNALVLNSYANDNTAIGYSALQSNTVGGENTAIGRSALASTTVSFFNTVVGDNAGSMYDMGYNNTILGANCDVTADGLYNCIAIGQAVTCNASSQAIIGNSATNYIGGYANWTNISDGRYKTNVQENVKGLEFIMRLKPVTYHLDATGISNKLNESRGKEMNAQQKKAIIEKELIVQTGFVAQEVEKAAKETGYDFSGVYIPKNENDFYGLRYGDFVVPLVKAMQEQQNQIELLKQQNELLLKRLEALETKLNK